MPHDGTPMTGRDPHVLADLIAHDGDDIWLGGEPGGDGGDRNYRPDLIARNDRKFASRQRKEPPPMANPLTDRLSAAVDNLRGTFNLASIDPFDAKVPGTVRRRIKAHNALLDIARIGRDKICGEQGTRVGNTDSYLHGPCILKAGHESSRFVDNWDHMDAEIRDRAFRYLAHSDPDPATRA